MGSAMQTRDSHGCVRDSMD